MMTIEEYNNRQENVFTLYFFLLLTHKHAVNGSFYNTSVALVYLSAHAVKAAINQYRSRWY